MRLPGAAFQIECVIEDATWVEAMRGADYRWQHEWKYQFLSTVTTVVDDTRWSVVSGTDRSVRNWMSLAISKILPSPAPTAIAIQSIIDLERLTKTGVAVKYDKVPARILISPGSGPKS